MTITFPSNTAEKIDQMREAIGRDITFNYVVTQSGCSVCTLDPVTNTSTNSFCTECGGEYWIDVISGTIVNAHIRWNSMDNPTRYPGGSVFAGECRAQIDYTETNITLVSGSDTLVVDDTLMSIDHVIYKGVPDLNRIVLILNEEEKDGG